MYLYRVDTLHAAWDVHTGCGNYSMFLSKLWLVHYVHSDTQLSLTAKAMADIKLFVLCVVMVVVCLELLQGQAQGDV